MQRYYIVTEVRDTGGILANPSDDHSILFSVHKKPEPDCGNDTGIGLLCGSGGGCLQRMLQVCKKAVLTGIGAVVVLIPVLLAGGLSCFGKAYQKERVVAILSIGDYAANFPGSQCDWKRFPEAQHFMAIRSLKNF